MSTMPTHHAIAERGKIHALAGDHVTAMMHYREAMSLAVKQGAPEVMFRHYMECAIESLERMGEHEEVLGYCERAILHYQDRPPAHDLARLDLASVHQRRGIALLRKGDSDGAKEALREAQRVLGGQQALPIARALLRWLDARMHVSSARLEAELERHRYYCVRRDSVSESRAVPRGHPVGGCFLTSPPEAR